MNLSGKTALVTGAGRGIGKGCALELARAGADLVINDRPGSEDLATVTDEIRALGRRCAVVEADAFSRTGCETLVTATLAAVEHVDILISNPAWGVRCDFLDYGADDFEKVIAATLTSGFYVSQRVARHMVERGDGGKIVFVSSVQAEMPLARSVAYCAAKAGLNHMAQVMSVELSGHRVNVNVIEPGWTDTPGEHETFSDAVIQSEGAKLPWGRLGTPEDIGARRRFWPQAPPIILPARSCPSTAAFGSNTAVPWT